jgi:hypothetical protein
MTPVETSDTALPVVEPFWGWIDVGWFLASLPLCFLGSMIAMRSVDAVFGLGMSVAGRLLTLQAFMYVLLFAALWFILELRHNLSLWPALHFPFAWRQAAGLIPAGFLLALGVAFLGAALHAPDVDNPLLRLLKDPLSTALVGLFASTLGPAAEEALFRGFLQPLIQKTAGLAAAILSTSLLFAALHGPQYAWSWRHLLLLSLASIAFGLTRARWNSTGAATLVHAVYNMTFFIGFLLQGRTFAAHG